MSFDEYYEYYLSLHQNRTCRRLHVAGQVSTILYLILIIVLTIKFSWLFLGLLLFSPFVVYPFAWSGHFFFEHNEPAAFTNPLWAKLCDWRMLYDILRGRIPL